MISKSPSSIERFLEAGPLLIDTETDSLRADFGLTFCVVIRPFKMKGRPGKSEVFVIDLSKTDLEAAERVMLRKLRRRLVGEFGFIAYYGVRFDFPWLQTRFAMQGIPLLPKVRVLDPYFTNKRVFNPGHVITSGRMAFVEELFKRGDSKAPMKHGVDAKNWRRVKFASDQKSLDHVVRHCVKDLDVLEYQVRRLAAVLPQRVPLR